MQIFRMEFDHIMGRMETARSTLSGEIVFTRALRALQFSPIEETTTSVALEAQNLSRAVVNLKNCTTRLYGTYKDTAPMTKTDGYMFLQESSMVAWPE